MKKEINHLFIDEAGDPGKPYLIDGAGNQVPTGSSLFYILVGLPLVSSEVFLLNNKVTNTLAKYNYKKEIKSTDVSLGLYKELLQIVVDLKLTAFYRVVNKETYKGKFAVDGNKKLHNIFDEYNLVKVALFALKMSKHEDSEVVIDRADRRLLDGNFENFNVYLKKRVNTKTINRVKWITHVNSEYVYAMQITDLVCGAIKDSFTRRYTDLKKIIAKNIKKIY